MSVCHLTVEKEKAVFGQKTIKNNPLVGMSQWLLWTKKEKVGSSKPLKLPVYANDFSYRRGQQGSESDRSQLVSFSEAYHQAQKNKNFGLGFALLPGDGIVGVDFDNCIKDGVIDADKQLVIDTLGGYWEYSPSGNGVRGFFRGKANLIDHANGIEVYSESQYLTVTGRNLPNSVNELVEFDFDILQMILSPDTEYRSNEHNNDEYFDISATHQTISINSDDGKLAIECLKYIDPNCGYSVWRDVASALKYRFGDSAREAFVQWSKRGEKFVSEEDCYIQYDRMFAVKTGSTNITLGTLIELAKLSGMPEEILRKKDELRADGVVDEQFIKDSMEKNDKDKPLKTYNNLKLILNHSSKIPKIRLDMLTDRPFWSQRPEFYVGSATPFGGQKFYYLHDRDVLSVIDVIYREYGILYKKQDVQDMLDMLATSSPFDPFDDVLSRVPSWDGVPRVDTWLQDWVGAEDNKYVRAVGRKTLCAAMKRLYQPGVKFDHVLILEGGQGFGKSTLIKHLAMGLSCDADLDFSSKDAVMTMRKYWIIELAELSSLSKHESNIIKKFITTEVDDVRAAYARYNTQIPRRSIFIGTTNDTDYLKDSTGNRRFWPVRIGAKEFDFEGFKSVVPQIWAEVKHIYVNEKLYLDADTSRLATKEQSARRLDDLREGEIITWLLEPKPSDWDTGSELSFSSENLVEMDHFDFCIRDIMYYCFNEIDYDMRTAKRISAILHSLEGVTRVGGLYQKPLNRHGKSRQSMFEVDVKKLRESLEG